MCAVCGVARRCAVVAGAESEWRGKVGLRQISLTCSNPHSSFAFSFLFVSLHGKKRVIFAQVKMAVRSQLHVYDDVQPEHFTPWATSPDPRCTLIRARLTVVLTAMPGCRSHPGVCGMFNINLSPSSSAHGLWHARAEWLRMCLHGRVPQLSDEVPFELCRNTRWPLRRTDRQYRLHTHFSSVGRPSREGSPAQEISPRRNMESTTDS